MHKINLGPNPPQTRTIILCTPPLLSGKFSGSAHARIPPLIQQLSIHFLIILLATIRFKWKCALLGREWLSKNLLFEFSADWFHNSAWLWKHALILWLVYRIDASKVVVMTTFSIGCTSHAKWPKINQSTKTTECKIHMHSIRRQYTFR